MEPQTSSVNCSLTPHASLHKAALTSAADCFSCGTLLTANESVETPLKKSKPDAPDDATTSCSVGGVSDTPAPPDAAAPEPVMTNFNTIATTTALLSTRLQREMKALWSSNTGASASHATGASEPQHSTNSRDGCRTRPVGNDVPSVVPSFKVGTLEMYRRFPEAYDMLMAHHDCTAVRDALMHDVLGRILRTADATGASVDAASGATSLPWLRVADFGCGTGRIESMVAQHPAVEVIYAYDSEVSMLRRCLANTVRSAAQSGHYSSVRLLPVAVSPEKPNEDDTTDALSVGPSSPFSLLLCGEENRNTPTAAALQLCLRPVSFQAIQMDFLRATQHPRCHLVVCAWSLSYVMRMRWGEDRWHAAVDSVVESLIHLLDNTHSDAAVMILETLGNGATEPTRQNTYTQRLEEKFGFTRTWSRTDYEFESMPDAERMVRFFFGEKMLAKLIADDADSGSSRCRLMECTGIWTYWKAREKLNERLTEMVELSPA